MQILIVGSGGREHALAAAVVKSPFCRKLFALPGNPGMADIAELVPFAADNVAKIVEFADAAGIDFVIVGPEAPLALGLVDQLTKKGILAFGPTKAAAQLESSKAFTKSIAKRYGIPTAAAEIFTDAEAAKDYLTGIEFPVVVKADGLAAGKGVTIAQTIEEAFTAVDEAMTAGRFGTAGAKLVIEDFLDGEELSFFALCDGRNAIAFGSAQDHKAAYDGDKGPNTGGMGAYSPAPLMTQRIEQLIMRDVIEPTLIAMADMGAPFRGVLFAGLMISNGKPQLIEYNVRFGDPECEVLMARLAGDIVPILMACAGGNIGDLKPELKPDAALTVIVAAKGYPGDYKTGRRIDHIDKAAAVPGVAVLHAGTMLDESGALVSNGGRVLAITATAPTLKEAQTRAYLAVDALAWPDGFCRRDIGWRAL